MVRRLIMRLRIAAIVCTILIGFISLDISSSLVSKSLAQETHKHENKKQSEMGRKAPIYITDEELDKVGVPDNWSFTLPSGDPKDGRQVFVEMECFKCHRIASENFPHIDSKASDVGPELTDEGAHH